MATSIVRLLEASAKIATVIDNVLAVDGMIFLASGLLSYLSLRREGDGGWIERWADLIFLAGLVLMVAASVMLAWELGHTPAG